MSGVPPQGALLGAEHAFDAVRALDAAAPVLLDPRFREDARRVAGERA